MSARKKGSSRAARPSSHPEQPFDTAKFINPVQVGGVEAYTIDDGGGRGVRALWVNTGAGLRYRVLVDRGLDIDQAFFHQHSLAFLSHKGVTAPTRALDRGLDWLKGFPGGLLTSCGPTNAGAPGADAGEELGLHGPHSNTAACLESVVSADPRNGRLDCSIVGTIRYGALYNPCIELRRTITSTLGQNTIQIVDEFFNAGNQAVPHAWLLHINFGYPLVDAGAELCFDAENIEPTDAPESIARFQPAVDFKRIMGPQESHRGPTSAVAHLSPRPLDRSGKTSVGIVNRNIGLGVAIDYNTREFPRLANWQHFGPHEYVTALEPVNGSANGRWDDRAKGRLDTLDGGGRRTYRYAIRVVDTPEAIAALRKLNA